MDSYRGWHAFAQHQGVSVVGLLEALGAILAGYDEATRLPDLLRQAVRDGRAIDAERRSRRGKERRL